jgi:subtilase-type serine protease
MRQFPPTPFRRKSALLISLSSLALLTACGGGEDGGLEDVFTISASPGGNGTLGSYFMASITDEWRSAAASFRNNSARFRLQGGNLLDQNNVEILYNGRPIFSNPLQSSRVDYAHAVGLSGAGEVIAVVDGGFRQGHEVFAGKNNSSTGAPGLDDHGTMVASIAAGNSGTMVGVAPGASLIFSDWGYNPVTNTTTVSDLTDAANAARIRGAVAQNNSWGYNNLPVNSTSFNTVFGDPQGAAWLAALRNYALGTGAWQGGVVVFAVDNDNTGSAGILDGLPLLQTDLQTAWLAVGNAVPIFDDNGVSAAARLESSPCYQSGPWCIMADGYWTAATAGSNRSYGGGTGSSFAAPQVSGALALLAQAFPNLTPHQLRARLLASADNTFTGFVRAGSVDLNETSAVFNHDYSAEYGHGFLDIRAALLPIGQTTMMMSDGATVTTKDYAFSTGGAMGDAVARSLEGIDLTMNDALGGDFAVAAKAFTSEAAPTALAETLAARTFTKDYGATRKAPLNPLADTFAAHPGQTLELNAPDGMTKASVLVGGNNDYGLAVAQTLTEGDLKLDLGVKFARDSGSLMGFSGAGDTGGATMAALTVSLSQDVGTGGFFALSGEMGIADLAAPTAISRVSTANFNSVRLDVGGRDVFGKGDRLSVGIAMPMAVSSGSADMTVPVRSADGTTEVRAVGINLAPEERQMDLSISYQVPMSESSELMFEVLHAENYGNIAGLTDSAAVLGMKWSF